MAAERAHAKLSRNTYLGNITKNLDKLKIKVATGQIPEVKKAHASLQTAVNSYNAAADAYIDLLGDDDDATVTQEMRDEASQHYDIAVAKISSATKLVTDFCEAFGLDVQAFLQGRDPPRRRGSVKEEDSDDERVQEGEVRGEGDPPEPEAAVIDAEVLEGREDDPDVPAPDVRRDIVSSGITREELYALMSLPKSEILTFDGNPLDFHSFMLTFEEQVSSLNVPDRLKLSRLLQHTTGAARNAIKSCTLMSRGGFREAMKILKNRFGNPFIISDTVIRGLKEGGPIRTADEMLQLADSLNNARMILKLIKMFGEVNTQETIVKICDRIPSFLRNRWRREVYKYKEEEGWYPGFVRFTAFVSTAAKEMSDPLWGEKASMTSSSGRTTAKFVSSSRKSSVEKKPNMSSFVTPAPVEDGPAPTGTYRRSCCILCSTSHNLLVCQRFRDFKLSDRWDFVRKNKLCINCLKVGHVVKDCRSEHVCSVDSCGERHSNFLHTKKDVVATTTHVENTATSATGAQRRESYLPCVNVRINGRCVVSALLDSGSSNTFCDRKLARTLGLKGRDVSYSMTTLTDHNKDISSNLVNFEVSSLDGKESLPFSNVYVIDSIPVGGQPVTNVSHDYLKDVKFADVRNVQLLIGQDQSEALLPLEIRKGLRGEPFAVRTLFGWALNGPNVTSNVPGRRVVANFVKTMAQTDRDFSSLIRMDDEGLCDDVGMSKQDKYVVQLWEQECVKVDGRYQLPIPFKPNIEVPNNFQVALSRLQRNRDSLQKRDLYDRYHCEIVKLLSEGYAERVPPGGASGDRVWYLPHQAVVTDKKPGKLRVVFDCAAKYKGESLNDKCFQGPNLTNRLLDVLLRFRQDPYVVVGDVQAMYYQVVIPPEQRDVLRFLWYEGDRVVHYRMTRHVFGGVWCSSSSSFALLKTVEDNPGYPDIVVNTIREAFYVDDCLRSLPEKKLVPEVLNGTRELLAKGGFNITKFIVNDSEVQSLIPESEQAKECFLMKSESVNSKALGINWSVTDDMFYFDVNLAEFVSLLLTKRKMLSLVSSLYDPLGLVGPMVVLGRLVLQEVTRMKLDWDDVVSGSLVDRWHRWVELLSSVSQVRIPRCIKPLEYNDAALELHCFSDASQVAYGAVSYLRCTNKLGQVSVRMVMAKSKVAPVKAITIPRLELQAALLAARLDATLRSELRLGLAPSYFWVDSEIVLRYLSNSSRRFHTFVANRVSAIQELTDSGQWSFVPGIMNPADLITRGKEMSDEERDRWFFGPKFLQYHKSEWPEFGSGSVVVQSEDDPELRPGSCFVVSTCVDRLSELFLRESSWYSLKRTLVWLARYFHYLRDGTIPERKITLPELEGVMVNLIRYIQGVKYGSEVRALKAGRCVPVDSSIVALGPMLDHRGILVVGGRLGGYPRQVVRPVIIPHDHPVAGMIVSDFHAVAHCGTEWTVSEIRKEFWITKVRVVVKSVSRRCMLCRRLFSRPCSQKMADLPVERVTPGGKPFSCVGIDCFGPFEVKLGRITVKRYGCIFTCFSVRAIHIEKLDSMDTDSFLNAFRRFVARRGRPDKVWSDNGSNFVGGSRELHRAIERLDAKAIAEYGVSQSIEWNFNPPLASHMGGVWERLIRTVRRVLLGISRGDYSFNDEVLSTWFCEVESMVNGRPITKVGDDPSNPAPLTPNHLLLLSGQNFGPPGNFSDYEYSRRWKRVQHLADVFWKRWVREYLPELQVRSKWHRQKENLRVGDFVLLLNEDTPRTLWPRGLVSEVFRSGDGLVRSVQVKTKSRSFVRPVNKVVLLEGSADP